MSNANAKMLSNDNRTVGTAAGPTKGRELPALPQRSPVKEEKSKPQPAKGGAKKSRSPPASGGANKTQKSQPMKGGNKASEGAPKFPPKGGAKAYRPEPARKVGGARHGKAEKKPAAEVRVFTPQLGLQQPPKNMTLPQCKEWYESIEAARYGDIPPWEEILEMVESEMGETQSRRGHKVSKEFAMTGNSKFGARDKFLCIPGGELEDHGVVMDESVLKGTAFQTPRECVVRIIQQWGLVQREDGVLTCNASAPREIRGWCGPDTTRGALRNWRLEEFLEEALRAKLLRAQIRFQHVQGSPKKTPEFALVFQLWLAKGVKVEGTDVETLLREARRVCSRKGLDWTPIVVEGGAFDGCLMHPDNARAKNPAEWMLRNVFFCNTNAIECCPTFKEEHARVRELLHGDTGIVTAVRRMVWRDWSEIVSYAKAIMEHDFSSRKPLMVHLQPERPGGKWSRVEVCTDCAFELRKCWEDVPGADREFGETGLRAVMDHSGERLKEHLRSETDTWCPGYAKRMENRRERAERKAAKEAESARAARQSAQENGDESDCEDVVDASNPFAALMNE